MQLMECSLVVGDDSPFRAALSLSRVVAEATVLCDRVAARPNNILQISTFVNVFEYFCLNKQKNSFRG